jgi:hemerythrin
VAGGRFEALPKLVTRLLLGWLSINGCNPLRPTQDGAGRGLSREAPGFAGGPDRFWGQSGAIVMTREKLRCTLSTPCAGVVLEMMKQIEWDKRFSVGHPEMDTEHQIIIGAINRCIELIGQEEIDLEAAQAVLQMLSRYADEHFSHEEALLEAVGSPLVGMQNTSHAVYSAKMERLLEQEVNRNSFSELVKFLDFWWMHHIQKEDMEYKYLFEQEVE